ncbi:MAG: glycosyltransferase family 39 protein [Myxococcales bacterium]
MTQAERELLSSHARGARLSLTGLPHVVRITLVACLLRALFVVALSAVPSWDGVIYERAAEQLAHGEGYTQRILDPSAPAKATAFFPPGYAAVLSVLHRTAGDRRLDPWFQVLCCSLLVPAAWYLGRRLGGARAGRVAAWLVALWPGGVVLAASWFTEPLFGVLLCVALIPLVYARRRNRTRMLFWAAFWLGLAAYVRPTSLVITPLLGFLVGWTRAERVSERLWHAARLGALALACSILPLTPWMVRNQNTLHAPVMVSTNGGLNLLLGTVGEGGYGSLDPRYDCPHGMPEVKVDRCRRDRALARIRRDPVAWLARGVLKVSATLGHDSAPAQVLAGGLPPGARSERVLLLCLAACRAYWLGLLCLFGVGLAAAAASALRQRLLFWLLCTPIVAMLALHFVYIGGDRYHAPFVPFMAAFAGACWIRLFPRAAPSAALKR